MMTRARTLLALVSTCAGVACASALVACSADVGVPAADFGDDDAGPRRRGDAEVTPAEPPDENGGSIDGTPQTVGDGGAGDGGAAEGGAASSWVTVDVNGTETRLTWGFADYIVPTKAMSIVGGKGFPSVNLFFPGQSPGVYSCTGDASAKTASVTYRSAADAGGSYQASSYQGDCTVTVTAVGPVGGRVTGSYIAQVKRSAAPTSLLVHGEFDVARISDTQ